MKKLVSIAALLLLALPAYAQDDFGFGDSVLSAGDIDALFGGGSNRGRGNNNNNNIPNPESLFLQMKDLLKSEKAPLTKDQEKALRPYIEKEVAAMRESLESMFGNRNNQNNQNNNQNRGNNNNQNQNNTANMLGELFKAITKNNTELLAAMKAEMPPDQAALITKGEKDKKVCLTLLDIINTQQLNFRNNNNNNNFNGGNFNFPGGGFEGIDGFGGGFEGGGNRGGGRGGRGNSNNDFMRAIPERPFCTSSSSTTAERLVPVSEVLNKGKKPLTADQETKFSGMIDAKLKAMEEELKASNQQMGTLLNELSRNRNNNNQNNNPQQLRNNIVNAMMQGLGIQTNNNNQGGRGRGGDFPNNFQNNNQNNQNAQNNNNQGGRGRGDFPNNFPNNNQNNQNAQNNNNQGNRGRGNNNNNNIQAELQKKNEELLDHIAASLNPPQEKIVKKYKYDQIKVKGGAERYRGIMDEEGTPLTAEQHSEIQRLFNSQNQALRQYADQLVDKEMAENPPPATPAPTQQQNNQQQPWNNNQNSNSVSQNVYAQQIVNKLLPQVSKQRALLEKVTQETIMKLLTPQQVASYKINSL